MSSSKELKEQIAAIKERIAREKEGIALFQPMIEDLRMRKKQIEEDLANIANNLKNNIDNLRGAEDTIRELQWQLNKLERALARAIAEENAYRLLMEKTIEFDSITMQAAWREFAFKHQVDGAKVLAAVTRGILGDKRGLGKTLTSVATIDMLRAKRVIYIVAKKFCNNLRKEVERWSGARSVWYLPDVPRKLWQGTLQMAALSDEWVFIINLEAWRMDNTLLTMIKLLCPDTVIVDEAHYINNETTNAWKGVRDLVYATNYCPVCNMATIIERNESLLVCNRCGYFRDHTEEEEFMSVKNVFMMTGSTVKNRPDDLWALLYLIDRKSFPKKKLFLDDYCIQLNGNMWGWSHGAEDRLNRELGMRYLARTRESTGVRVPPQEIQKIELDFLADEYPEQYALYKQVEREFAIRLNEDENMPITAIIAQITRLRQVLTYPKGIKFPVTDWEGKAVKDQYRTVEVSESIKIDKAQELIAELVKGEGERVVVFSKFTAPLYALADRIRMENSIKSVVYAGGMSDERVKEIQIDFDARTKKENPDYETKWDVVLCTFAMGSESVNFNAATQVIFLDREWNPAGEDQATGRVQRIGQENETTVHILHCLTTIDEWMDNINKVKADVIAGFEDAHAIRRELLAALGS